MPDITPFKAYYYNVKNQEELEKLVAPPHDVISAAERSAFIRKNPDNIVQVILPDNYSKAREKLESLIEKNRLIQQKETAFYIYKTKQVQNGVMKERYGLLALVKLSDFAEKQIIPHEKTFKKVTEGRFNLLRETNANCNPIFFLFDGNTTYTDVLQKYLSKAPFLIADDRDKVEHSVWIIDDPLDIQNLQESFKTIPLLIADGHHRYTSALALSKENHSNYIFGLLVDMNDPNLQVFPTHRLVRYISGVGSHEIIQELKKNFNLEVYDFPEGKMMNHLAKTVQRLENIGEYAFGILFYGINSFFIITLKEEFHPGTLIEEDISKECKELDVSLLHEFLFKQILSISQYIDDSENVFYIKNLEDAVQSVHKGLYQALFILNPTKVEQILKITECNETMPHKSTYFYPKPLSGLIIYKWEP